MFARRLGILSLGFVVLTLTVMVRLFWIQVVHGAEFRERSEVQNAREIAEPALRGPIRDHSGSALASDRCAYTLHFVPARMRERSLLYALLDLKALLPPEALDEGPTQEAAPVDMRALRAAFLKRPFEHCIQLLSRSARELRLENDDLLQRFEALVRPEGDLLRLRTEGRARLLDVLSLVAGFSVKLTPKGLARLAGTEGTIAEGLAVDPESVGERLLEELRLLERVAAEVALEDSSELWGRVDALFARERKWIEMQLADELRDAAALDLLGTARPSPESMGAENYFDFARNFEVRFPSDHDAALALERADALLSGRVPRPLHRLSDVGDTNPDAQSFAASLGLFDLDPIRVLDAWFAAEQSKPGFTSLAHVSSRRERELLARYRAARGFVFGRRAKTKVASYIVGASKLSEIGFSLEPTFVRDDEIAENIPMGLRLLVGAVSEETGRPRFGFGLELGLDREIAARPGQLRVTGTGATEELRPARHGQPISTTLDIDLCRRLERVCRGSQLEEPAAIVIIDCKTGGILGLSTWPLPTDIGKAYDERLRLEAERRLLRRVYDRGLGFAHQRLDFLNQVLASDKPDPELQWEASVLASALEQPPEFVASRVGELGIQLARTPALHRAIESKEHSPPGSVFKAVTLLFALEAGVIQRDSVFPCVGMTGRRFHGCKDHGPEIRVREALARSCNAFCYEVGVRLTVPGFVDALDRLGIFDPIPGLLASDLQLKAEILADAAANGDRNVSKNLAIGEGSLRMTPVRAAGVAASLATGRVVHPHIYRPDGFEPFGQALASHDHLAAIRDGMRAVIGVSGTVHHLERELRQFRVAAKTGTAPYEIFGKREINQAWFVGFAPADASDTPEIAFAIVQMHTAEQGRDSAQLTKRVLEAFGESFPARRWW